MTNFSVRSIIIICLLVQLCACGLVTHRTKTLGATVVNGTANNAMQLPRAAAGTAGDAVGQTLGLNSTKYTELVSDLKNQGVFIQPNGQEMSIIIPADSVFVSCTPRLREDGVQLMTQLSQFLQYYSKYSVEISVYSDNKGDKGRALALTRAQARVFSRYLWEHNFDARVLSAQGYGAILPIGNNGFSEGRDMNRRIEINFRQLS